MKNIMKALVDSLVGKTENEVKDALMHPALMAVAKIQADYLIANCDPEHLEEMKQAFNKYIFVHASDFLSHKVILAKEIKRLLSYTGAGVN